MEGFERYLRRAFLGQKQFSIEGLDVMAPMLDEAIELAAANGGNHVVGMAHRGRLNVLAHTVGRATDAILREFEASACSRPWRPTSRAAPATSSTTSARRPCAKRRAAM